MRLRRQGKAAAGKPVSSPGSRQPETGRPGASAAGDPTLAERPAQVDDDRVNTIPISAIPVSAIPVGAIPPALGRGGGLSAEPAPGGAPGPAQGAGPAQGDTGSRPRRGWLTLGLAGVAVLAVGLILLYSALLPAPAQNALHGALGFVGVPGSDHAGPGTAGSSVGGGSATGPAPGGRPSPPFATGTALTRTSATSGPSGGSPAPGRSRPAPGGHSGSPSGSPSPSGATSPSPSDTSASPAPVKPTAVAITSVPARLPAGTSLSVTGLLTGRGNAPVPDRGVRLDERIAGDTNWRVVAHGRTNTAGQVVLTVPALDDNAQVMLNGPSGLLSQHAAVRVVPPVSLSVSTKPLSAGLTVDSPLTSTGDLVDLQVREGQEWTTVRQGGLPASHEITFTVDRGLSARRYRAVLPSTVDHARSLSPAVSVPALL